MFQSLFTHRWFWISGGAIVLAFPVLVVLWEDENYEFHSALLSQSIDSENVPSNDSGIVTNRIVSELANPVRLMADGEFIDIGKLSNVAHAGPCIADIDGDGDRDLLVGDFPGNFWVFKNQGDDNAPRYTSAGKLQAGGVDAKTPVY